MKRFLVVAAVCLPLTLVPALAFSQATTATLNGTVSDASGALIPGVTVTARDDATGVETVVITNASGAYNFAALQPGTYTVSAELAAFQTATYTEVRLTGAAQVRLNFVLQVAGAATEVEVLVSADDLLLESSSSVGDVLEQQEIVDLPLVSNNVLDLIDVMAGVQRQTEGFVLGIQGDFAGVDVGNINVVRDGVSVTDQRWSSAGLNSTTVLHPDMVGEMKMILAPVDAETGRGSGQVQITTRSGGNEYHGGAVWNVKNTALDARTWEANNNFGGPPPQNWDNFHQYTVNFGGPIVENKTFFFALWDQNITKTRDVLLVDVLSPCAQRGIFRYWDGWVNGAADDQTVINGVDSSRPSVDFQGNPLAPATFPDGTPHNQILRHVSPFGSVGTTGGAPMAADCGNAIVGAAPTGIPGQTTWDPFRTSVDTTGYFDLLLGRMPQPNTYEDTGDGLNVQGFRWTRVIDGRDNLFGVGEPNPRKQININIDHIFNQSHKLDTSYTLERVNADDTPEGWPGSYEGRVRRQPQVLSVNLISTLSPNVVNEARFGMSRMGTNVLHSTDVPGNEEVLDLLPNSGGLPLLTQWDTPFISWSGENGGLLGARGNGPAAATVIDTSPRWTFTDTVSWTSGRHSYKFGGTYILATSKTEEEGDINNNSNPTIFIGSAALAPITAFEQGGLMQALQPCTSIDYDGAGPGAPVCAGLMENTGDDLADLLNFYSGSLESLDTTRFINSPDQAGTSWNDPFVDQVAIRDLKQNEINAFFKDDWKVNDDLTLNLGMRYDYYGVPFDKGGMTMTIEGGGGSIFWNGTDYSSWMQPGGTGQNVEFIFVGPGTDNPDLSVYDRDLNNFGPAVGFSYNVPWLGQDRTVVRGGYQVSFLGGGQGDVLDSIIQTPPGSLVRTEFNGPNGGQFFNLQDVVNGVGMPPGFGPSFLPVEPVPVTDRNVNLTVFDPGYVTPYIQNLTLSVTHRLNSALTFDVKYIGTLSRKQAQNFLINEPNLYNTLPGDQALFDALVQARAGADPQLLNDLFTAVNGVGTPTPINPFLFGGGPVDGVNITGADFLRSDFRFNDMLADGNIKGVANALTTLNYSNFSNPALPPVGAGEQGAVLRASRFPENWITSSPQFGNGAPGFFGPGPGAFMRTNLGHQNYHSLQSELTIRPTYGLNGTFSYTWAKSLNRNGPFTIPWDRAADYRLDGRAHNFRAYGTYRLPIGPNQLLFGNSSGVWARVAEGWQMSWIYNMNSGTPANLTSTAMAYNNNEPWIIDGASFNNEGTVDWPDGATVAGFWAEPGSYSRVLDPQCTDPAIVAPSLQGQCNRNAIEDSAGNLIFRTPLPGQAGNYRDQLRNPGSWTLDMAVSKRIQIREDISMDVRMDATNIFNHPTPANPNVAVQGGGDEFGTIDTKNGSRIFQLKARIDF